MTMSSHVSFEADEHTLLEDLAFQPHKADPAALQETYFVFPIRFLMNGVNLFTTKDGSTLQLPLIGFSSALRRGVQQLANSDTCSVYLAGGGQFLLSRRGDDAIAGFCSISGVRSSDAYDQVAAASRQFSEDVSMFLQQECPELARIEAWPFWFSEI